MSQCGEEEEGVPPTEESPDEEQPSSSHRVNQQTEDPAVSSCLSMRSDRSMDVPLVFKRQESFSGVNQQTEDPASSSCLSMRSDRSMDVPLVFKQQESFSGVNQQTEDPAVSSCFSLRSDRSMDVPLVFKRQESFSGVSLQTQDSALSSSFSPSSDRSMDVPLVFKWQESFSGETKTSPEYQTDDLESIFMVLEDELITLVKYELKKLRKLVSRNSSEGFEGQDEDEEVNHDEEEQRRSFLKIAVQGLRRMKQLELAALLHNKTSEAMCRRKVKSNLKSQVQCTFEGIVKAGNQILLNQMYTDLYITQGGTAEVNDEHEVRQVERSCRNPAEPGTAIRCEDIFKPSPGRDNPIRTVMTKGVAGIGKTVLTQKFSLDWAEGKANQDIHFVFPFSFRELNLVKDKKFSLVELVHFFFHETKEAGLCQFEDFQIVFIFDGLDECRLPLDFVTCEILTDVSEPTSVNVLLANLIRGKLLPSARIWITSRPAAASQIPPDCLDVVTEVRGFTNPQKDDYFRKKFREEEEAKRIISHIKKSRSLHIMCHNPVFCWMTATVLEDVLDTGQKEVQLPNSLTRMYIEFLVVLAKRKNIKYDGGTETDPCWTPETRKMVETLAKLAFEQLLKGNIYFYESDLTDCGIDVTVASVYSGVFTQIFRREIGLYQKSVFGFIHLSIQEFLAALHVHLTYVNTGVNLFSKQQSTWWSYLIGSKPRSLYKSAIDKALQSPNGNLDLFLRFLMGLSLEENQICLQGLVTQSRSNSLTNKEAAEYIKTKISEIQDPEKSINLFHCLKEMKDCSLLEQIHQHLVSGSLNPDSLSPSDWSALAFILLSSDEDLVEFDLKKYSGSEKALLWLLPVVKSSTKAMLSCCNLSERSCEGLASVLASQLCSLQELDLSDNDLQDSGVKTLCKGLQSPHCKLKTLSLSGCQLTTEGFASLASALSANPSHLEELDLAYNHPGASGVERLSAGLSHPNWALKTLRVDPSGLKFLSPGLKKYASKLTLDTNTANRKLLLSERNRKVTLGQTQRYPKHLERFDYWKQLLCTEGLSGRCYWEVEWEGQVHIAVAYKGMERKRQGTNSCLGKNDQSWSLCCTSEGYSGLHDNQEVSISKRPFKRVGVYLDCPAGTVSFFSVFPEKTVHLHTFHATFTEPLHAAFRLEFGCVSSVLYLCQI